MKHNYDKDTYMYKQKKRNPKITILNYEYTFVTFITK